jgi:glycosyltransferase involved in cell wall biosynthesis
MLRISKIANIPRRSSDCNVHRPPTTFHRGGCSVRHLPAGIFQLRFLTVATQALSRPNLSARERDSARLPISVVIAVRNEERNLARCLESLASAAQVYLVDSFSTDRTAELGRSYGAEVVQFHYRGGWPKKRQWALDTLPLAYDWVLLLDADECLTPALEEEIRRVISDARFNGYYLKLQMYFLGRELRRCGAGFYKLSLFRRGQGRFECRLRSQDDSMCDMEVHEHVVVDGRVGKLENALIHHNVESLSRYIQKHDQYSNWESRVLGGEEKSAELEPRLFGNQAQRRRWLKKWFFKAPGSPVLLFFYRYIFALGFLDGVPGLIYCGFQAVQMFHTKAKIYEQRVADL